MKAKVTSSEALGLLAEALNEPVEGLSPDRLRESIPGWDSMGALLLIAELDERFGVELSAEQMRQMRRVEDFLEFMRKHGLLQE
jgi:acyl carrier protein